MTTKVFDGKIIVLDYKGKIRVYDLDLGEEMEENIGELARRIHLVYGQLMIHTLQGSLIKFEI